MSINEDRHQRIVDAVVKKFGPIIDLNANPGVLIEILQQFSSGPDDGGPPPGPPPTPDPCLVEGLGPSVDDLMRELIQLRRDVADIASRLSLRTP